MNKKIIFLIIIIILFAIFFIFFNKQDVSKNNEDIISKNMSFDFSGLVVANRERMPDNMYYYKTKLIDVAGSNSDASLFSFQHLLSIKPIWYKSNIFYQGIDGSVNIYNLKTHESNTISLSKLTKPDERGQSNLLSLYVNKDDNIYYLVGDAGCRYRPKCNLDLYNYNLTTKKNKFIAGGITTKRIVWIDNEKNIIYVDGGYGDAGYILHILETARIDTGELSEYVKWLFDGNSQASEETLKQKEKYNEIIAKSESYIVEAKQFDVQNGDVVKIYELEIGEFGREFGPINFINN